MNRKTFPDLLASLVLSTVFPAETQTAPRIGWQVQLACKRQADGETITLTLTAATQGK